MASTSSFPSLANVMVICCSLWFLSLHPSRSEDVFFPSQPSVSSIQYRSLRDLLFQSESAEIEASDLPVVLASFHPDDPSPTLASPQIASKDGEVSPIRFLDSDALSIPDYFDENDGEDINPTALYQEGEEEELDVEIIPPVLVRQSASKTTEEQDRWSWPSTTKAAIEESYQSRALGSAAADNKASLSLVVRKTVAKPYRLLPRTASCPKLLHDLNITCSLPTQLIKKQPVVFQWYKTQYNSATAASANNLVDQTVKVPVAYGTHLLHRDSRYAVSATADTATLTIRQLKVDDCGRYVCEALHSQNATVISLSEFLIFLCY